MKNEEIKNEIDKIKRARKENERWEDKVKRKDLKYATGKNKYDFQQNETTRSNGESIYSGKISIHEADMDQINLLKNLKKGNDKSRLNTE